MRTYVVALRERYGRTIPFVGRTEAEGVNIARGIVDADATIFADEGSHWDLLDHDYKTGRVNHSTEYSLVNGKHTNWVESLGDTGNAPLMGSLSATCVADISSKEFENGKDLLQSLQCLDGYLEPFCLNLQGEQQADSQERGIRIVSSRPI